MVCPKAINLSQMGSLLNSPLIAAGNQSYTFHTLTRTSWSKHRLNSSLLWAGGLCLASAQQKRSKVSIEDQVGSHAWPPHQRSYNNISPVLSACVSLFQTLPVLRFGLVGLALFCLGRLPPPYPQLFFWLHYKWDVEKQFSDWRQLPLFSLGFGMSVCVGACASPAAVYMSYVRKGSDAPRAAEVHTSIQQKASYVRDWWKASLVVTPWHANASASRKHFLFVCLFR